MTTKEIEQLRNDFFDDCVDAIPGGSLQKVNMTPHNLFEWFKVHVSQFLPSEPQPIGWVKWSDKIPESPCDDKLQFRHAITKKRLNGKVLAVDERPYTPLIGQKKTEPQQFDKLLTGLLKVPPPKKDK